MVDRDSVAGTRAIVYSIIIAFIIAGAVVFVGLAPPDALAEEDRSTQSVGQANDVQQAELVSQVAGATQAERNIDDTELVPGESTTVTVDIELDESADPTLIEEFDSPFKNVDVTDANPPSTIQAPRDDNTGLVVAWQDQDSVSVGYEFTLPDDAQPGDVFTVTGDVTIEGEPITVSGDSQIEVVGSNFDATITNTNSPVEVGEELEVTVEIENTGDVEDTQDVEFRFDDNRQETQSVTLSSGEAQTTTFEFDTSGVAPGDYDTEVRTGDSSDTETVTVQQPAKEANFQLSNLDPADATVTTGDDPIDISADVENVGNESDGQDIELTVTSEDSEEIVYSDTVEDLVLDGGESTTVTFEDAPAGDLAVGGYTHKISSDDGSVDGSLTVEEGADQEPVYWQVDFAAGAEPPSPPSYWPDDLMAALGNSDDGVTQGPSLRRQQTDGQLGDVTITDNEFKFDDEGNPTEVTVEFEVDEDGEARNLHLAAFTLPGPFDEDEIDQQELFDSTSGTYEGGDTGTLTVSIPQADDG